MTSVRSLLQSFLPLSMVKPHVESQTVCDYDESPVQRRITPPSAGVPGQELIVDMPCVVTNEDGELTDEDILLLGTDAENDLGRFNPETVRGCLELIRQAKVVADAGARGQIQCLFHAKLPTVPEKIPLKWSAVLGDGFHVLALVKVPEKHELKKAFKIALMKAFYAYDEKKLASVIDTLKSQGWTEREIESTLYYRPAFFSKRVERTCLPNRQLYF
jgi:hypothetical protein